MVVKKIVWYGLGCCVGHMAINCVILMAVFFEVLIHRILDEIVANDFLN